jgi:hypothetical protein
MQLSRRFEGKKYMWDGQAYADEAQAGEASRKYQTDGFMTQTVKEDGQVYVFTRKEVKEIVVEGKSA